MKTIILNKLTEIEKKNNIKIVFACESGSRAWGFPSPDSDYDVRFIYVRPLNYYLSVAERDDQLGFAINDELDISGWDLRKVLQLMRKSNTTVFEWLQSPIIYKEDANFRNDLWNLCSNYFSQRANIYHYLGITKGAYDTIENESEINIKKLFYVLRPLLSAKWNLEKNTIAPMSIEPLMSILPNHLLEIATELIKIKSTAAEGFIIKINEELKGYIDEEFNQISNVAKEITKDTFELNKLDDFFLKTIKYYDN
ncbi:MAG: nucleotidyltransferase domain-containing protein [Bacteroidetes bacterium]|nr:nucleotidyltransferase domain-containing protein [Bacteroidota bacterium]MBL0080585.1 nucleotidyltransferase domain-containing protein [Bacteroidota bacterium]